MFHPANFVCSITDHICFLSSRPQQSLAMILLSLEVKVIGLSICHDRLRVLATWLCTFSRFASAMFYSWISMNWLLLITLHGNLSVVIRMGEKWIIAIVHSLKNGCNTKAIPTLPWDADYGTDSNSRPNTLPDTSSTFYFCRDSTFGGRRVLGITVTDWNSLRREEKRAATKIK